MKTANILPWLGFLMLLSCCSLATAAADHPAGPPAGAGIAGPNRQVILMVLLTIKKGEWRDFMELFTQMRDRSKHTDRGNVRYELYSSAPMTPQAAGDSGRPPEQRNFVSIEEWKDAATFQAHGKWAGPIVATTWRKMTDSMQVLRLEPQSTH